MYQKLPATKRTTRTHEERSGGATAVTRCARRAQMRLPRSSKRGNADVQQPEVLRARGETQPEPGEHEERRLRRRPGHVVGASRDGGR